MPKTFSVIETKIHPTCPLAGVQGNMSVYRTAATLGQILDFVGAAQKQKTKVRNLPPIGHIKILIINIGLRKILADNCNLPKNSKWINITFLVAEPRKRRTWTTIGQIFAQATRPYGMPFYR